MTKVTIESLTQRIAELESRPRSLNEDYQLEAYRMLLALKLLRSWQRAAQK